MIFGDDPGVPFAEAAAISLGAGCSRSLRLRFCGLVWCSAAGRNQAVVLLAGSLPGFECVHFRGQQPVVGPAGTWDNAYENYADLGQGRRRQRQS
jgi:hypothetical protein